MKPIPRDAPPSEKRVAPPAASLNEFSPRERWFVRGLIALAVTVIAAGLWQTVVRDAMLAARRLPVFRRVVSRPSSNIEVAANRQESRTASPHSLAMQSASSGLTGLPSTSRSFDERVALNTAVRPAANAAAVEDEAKSPADLPLAVNAAVPADKTTLQDKPAMPDKPGTVDAVSVDLLQAAAQLVSFGWQDFAYPATWSASETSKPRMLYNSHRNSLLNAITRSKPSALSLIQLRKDYATAREQFHDDPRLDYAFGLALWHHGERSEALELFQTAARLEGTPFLPAALAVGWGRLLNGEERRGLDQLSHVAKLIGNSSDPASNKSTPLAPALRGEGPGVTGSSIGTKPAYPTEPQREYAALCLGRAFGFLTGPGRTSELGEAADLTARNVRDHLPTSLLSEFELGFAQVGQRQSDLLQFASLPQNALATEHRQQSDELQTRIDTLREEMQLARDELARDHLSYLTTVTKYVTDTLKARAESSKLNPLAQKLKASIMQLYQPQPHVVMRSPSGELVPVSSSTTTSTGSRTGRTTSLGSSSSSSRSSSRNGQNSRGNINSRPQIFLMPETTEERAARMAKLEKARTELKRIQTELATLRERHKTLLDQKHQAEADQKTETKEQQQAQADRRREQRDLERKLKELNTALRQMQSLHNSLDTVAAYVPWTTPVEGEALRQALARKSDPATNSSAIK